MLINLYMTSKEWKASCHIQMKLKLTYSYFNFILTMICHIFETFLFSLNIHERRNKTGHY